MGKTTTAVKEFEVTLAHKVNSNKLSVKSGVFIQPKLDGVRCYTRLVDGEIRMFSRNHKEFMNCEHLKTQLHGIFEQHPDIILDGELYNHKYRDNFNKIISLVRKQKPTQAEKFESASQLQYHVYDVFDQNYPEALYVERLNFLHNNIRKMRSVKRVDTKCVSTEKGVQKFHKINKDAGYEGSMLRGNVPYEQKRSWNLQKVKDWHDTEFQIKGFVEGNGKFEGGLGKFIGLDLETGREIEVPWPNITIEKRIEVWKNRFDYTNKIATFEYFERTPAGAYRFPRFKAVRNYE